MEKQEQQGGNLAAIDKALINLLYKALKESGLDAILILQVHDELIVEAPETEVEQVKRILKEEMEQVVQYRVPLTAEVGVGTTWLEAH